jgi:hypothetical protein
MAWAATFALCLGVAGSAQASPFTRNSPAGGPLPSSVTEIGGIVVDMIGTNGVRVISELPASSLYMGFSDTGTPAGFRGNPLTIGIQTGYTPAVTGALGGGIQKMAVRFTLFDGDTASGDFDFNDNQLRINGIAFGAPGSASAFPNGTANGNWSAVTAQNTDSLGNVASGGLSTSGFRDNTLDTGFFSSTDPTTLANIFNSLVSQQQITFTLFDRDPTDNFFDFTQGINGSLLNVGQGPIVSGPGPAVDAPEPASYLLFGAGILAAAGYRRWRRRRTT